METGPRLPGDDRACLPRRTRARPLRTRNGDHDLTGSGVQVLLGDDRRQSGAAADVVDDVAPRLALLHLRRLLGQVTSIDIPVRATRSLRSSTSGPAYVPVPRQLLGPVVRSSCPLHRRKFHVLRSSAFPRGSMPPDRAGRRSHAGCCSIANGQRVQRVRIYS